MAKKSVKRQPVRKAVGKRSPAKKKETPPSQLEQAPAPAPPPPGPEMNDLSELPSTSGPFVYFRVEVGEDTDLPARALWIAKRIHRPVEILDSDGEVARVLKPGLKTYGTTPRSEGKQARVVALLLRPEGATKDEITAITEWGFGDRWIRRLAKSSQSKMEIMAKNHWRLTKD